MLLLKRSGLPLLQTSSNTIFELVPYSDLFEEGMQPPYDSNVEDSGYDLQPVSSHAVLPGMWRRNFSHEIPQPDLPHPALLPVLAERARDPALFFQQTQLLHRNMTGFLLCGGTRMCACAAEQRRSVSVGTVYGRGLSSSVGVSTRMLVRRGAALSLLGHGSTSGDYSTIDPSFVLAQSYGDGGDGDSDGDEYDGGDFFYIFTKSR